MLKFPEREQGYRYSASIVAFMRWPATVFALLMLCLYAFGLFSGEDKLWPPSAIAGAAAYACFSACLSWTGWYDLQARKKGDNVPYDDQKRYRFWKWRGTPRWLIVLQALLLIPILVPLIPALSKPARLYALAFVGFIALLSVYDYLRWKSRHAKQ